MKESHKLSFLQPLMYDKKVTEKKELICPLECQLWARNQPVRQRIGIIKYEVTQKT